ncbi:hypothetical protein Tco_0668067 [Tanacetum coccineum]
MLAVAAGRWLPVEEELLATCYVAVSEDNNVGRSWFRWISFDYRVTLGFGSIAGGLDHVNPVIRLPLKRGINMVPRLGDHPNPNVGTNPVTASIT